jgi:hypothetical protein
MKFTRTVYPDYPGVKGSPCWQIKSRWLYADADWNTRFPFGTSLGVRIGPREPEPPHKPECKTDCRCEWPERRPTPGFTLDLNAPLGEPNRLYLTGPRRRYMIGLLSWHGEVETGTRQEVIMGREQTVHLTKTVRCWPRLIRGQAWDWRRCEGTRPSRFRWLVVHPNDYRERWAAAHPAEAAERTRKRVSG